MYPLARNYSTLQPWYTQCLLMIARPRNNIHSTHKHEHRLPLQQYIEAQFEYNIKFGKVHVEHNSWYAETRRSGYKTSMAGELLLRTCSGIKPI